MKVSIQSREKALIFNILFGIDDLPSSFGPTNEVLSDFMKFSTKSKWNILINIHCLDTGQISFQNRIMLTCYS